MKHTLNIIHDNRRSEKYDPLVNELREQKIFSYIIHPATVLKHSVVESINASHKKIIRAAKEAGLPYVIIAEDDVMFTSVGAWQYYIDNMPESFDLYLGCTYVKPFSLNKVAGFQLYTVHEKFYDTFLSAPDTDHIDIAMNELGGDYHICLPVVALQRPGYSANNNAYANYNHQTLAKEDLYKK
jgi:hypothetical protein